MAAAGSPERAPAAAIRMPDQAFGGRFLLLSAWSRLFFSSRLVFCRGVRAREGQATFVHSFGSAW